MALFQSSASKAQKMAQKRDGYFRTISNALEAGSLDIISNTVPSYYGAIHDLMKEHAKDPQTLPFLINAMEKVALKDAHAGLTLAQVMLSFCHRPYMSADLRPEITAQAFKTTGFARKDNQDQMRKVVLICQAIAEASAENSLDERRAIHRWDEASAALKLKAGG